MAYQSVNPYDGKILKTFKELTETNLRRRLETLRPASTIGGTRLLPGGRPWSQKPPPLCAFAPTSLLAQ